MPHGDYCNMNYTFFKLVLCFNDLKTKIKRVTSRLFTICTNHNWWLRQQASVSSPIIIQLCITLVHHSRCRLTLLPKTRGNRQESMQVFVFTSANSRPWGSSCRAIPCRMSSMNSSSRRNLTAQSERQSRQNTPISNSRDLSSSMENLSKPTALPTYLTWDKDCSLFGYDFKGHLERTLVLVWDKLSSFEASFSPSTSETPQKDYTLT